MIAQVSFSLENLSSIFIKQTCVPHFCPVDLTRKSWRSCRRDLQQKMWIKNKKYEAWLIYFIGFGRTSVYEIKKLPSFSAVISAWEKTQQTSVFTCTTRHGHYCSSLCMLQIGAFKLTQNQRVCRQSESSRWQTPTKCKIMLSLVQL